MNIRSNLAVATVAATMAFAGAAGASTFIDTWTTNSITGAISVPIGDDGLGTPGGSTNAVQGNSTHVYDAGTGVFTDTFDFFLPTGQVGASLTSSDKTNHLVFAGITFNGAHGVVGTGLDGDPGAAISSQLIVKGSTQELVLTGTGGAAASYAGTANFSPVAVPEPASWALMIIGFGSAGAMLRRRRQSLAAAA